MQKRFISKVNFTFKQKVFLYNLAMIGLLPASGSASRLGGIPKFLLPCTQEGITLIEQHVILMEPFVEKVVLVTRARWLPLIEEMNINVDILIKEPSSMNDAIIYAASKYSSENYLIGMPDTFFSNENPYAKISNIKLFNQIVIACWEISNDLKGRVGQIDINDATGQIYAIIDKDPSCNFNLMWGALRLSHKIINCLDSKNPHPGIDLSHLITPFRAQSLAVKVDGTYYDVGTLSGYFSLLKLQLEHN